MDRTEAQLLRLLECANQVLFLPLKNDETSEAQVFFSGVIVTVKSAPRAIMFEQHEHALVQAYVEAHPDSTRYVQSKSLDADVRGQSRGK
jgi:ABC-type antimicrobial peptide transport system ATPase subunit